MDLTSLFFLDSKIYILFSDNPYTCILQYNHNYILSGHFSQNKTLELICNSHFWPSLHANV